MLSYRVPNPVRDVAFLFGPLAIAVMKLLITAAAGTAGFLGRGLEWDFPLIHGLEYFALLGRLTLWGFLWELDRAHAAAEAVARGESSFAPSGCALKRRPPAAGK